MRLSRATGYALNAFAFLARSKSSAPVSTKAIAAATGIPTVFLLKALKPCVDRDLLLSVTGPHGGYRLARPAQKISVLDVIEAVEGPITSGTFAAGSPRTATNVDRFMDRLLREATEKTRGVFASVTIAKVGGRKG